MRKKRTTKRRRKATRKRSYVSNPKRRPRRRTRRTRRAPVAELRRRTRRRSYRKNPSLPVVEGMTLLGTAILAGVAGAKVTGMIPFGSAMMKNVGLALAGALVAIMGYRKPLVLGAGAGMVVVGGTRALTSAVPMLAGDDDLTADEQKELVDMAAATYSPELEAIEQGGLAGVVPDVSSLNGPVMGGTLDGALSGPLM